MEGGSKGLLVNRFDVCKQPVFSNAKITGQNGVIHTQRPRFVAASCKNAKAKRTKRADRARGAGR